MRKKLFLLVGFMGIISVVSGIFILLTKQREEIEDKMTVVTSFYPMYIATKNIIEGTKGVELVNLTENQAGCVHDYQVTTADMKKMEYADLFIINGGGMESFVTEVLQSYPDIKIIEASAQIPMLPLEETNEILEEESSEHDHGEWNAHVWMNLDYYITEVENIEKGLSASDPKRRGIYRENASKYIEKLKVLKLQMEQELTNPVNQKIVIFHDAFFYLAKEFSLDIIYGMELEEDTALSAGEIKNIVNKMRIHDVKTIFVEKQYGRNIAESIAAETGAKVWVLDALISGENSLDAYIKGMEENIRTLKQALY